METFSALLAICAGNSPVPGEFPAQRPVTRSFDVFFNLHKRLGKQSWGWWFETLPRPLWRHSNGVLRPFVQHFWMTGTTVNVVGANPKEVQYKESSFTPWHPLQFKTKHGTTITISTNQKPCHYTFTNMLMVNDNKTEFLIVGSKLQLERVNIHHLFMWVRIRSHMWCQCETWVWFFTQTWKWICKSQRRVKLPTIMDTASEESENSWRLYMHLSQAWLITATVWWMDN